MTPKERLEILRKAKPGSWIAFSEDESRVVAQGATYDEVIDAAEKAGEAEPVVLKIPAIWSPKIYSDDSGAIRL